MVGDAAQAGDAAGLAGVERGPERAGVGAQARIGEAGDAAVHADDERGPEAEPRLEIVERRKRGAGIAGGDRGAEAEIARQQAGGVAELAGAQLEQAVEHGRAGDELAAHLALGGGGDDDVERDRDQAQREREQARIEDREPGADAAGTCSIGPRRAAAAGAG